MLGIVLFAWFVHQVGPGEIWQGLRSVGWGFVPIIGVTGVRFALRASAWRLCFERERRIPFRTAFAAVLAGDAIGNVTPLGLIASEPTKAAYVRHAVSMGPAVAAVAIETLLYTLTVAAMIAATTIALLFSVDVSPGMRKAGIAAVAAILAGFAVTIYLVWRRPVIVKRVLVRILPARSALPASIERLHDLEQQILTFAARRGDVLLPVLAVELTFHALGVLEIYLTLWLILGAPQPFLTTFILEGANRLVQVVFKPVPFRTGVDEITTGTFTQLLGYGVALGTTLAIVRKVRTLFWVLVGTIIFVRRGLERR